MRFPHVLPALALTGFVILITPILSAASTRNPNSPASCCTGQRGNIDGKGIVDLVDLSSLILYLTASGYVPPCLEAANVDGKGPVDITDLATLLQFLEGFPVQFAPCGGDTTYVADSARIAALNAVTQFVSLLDTMSVDSFNQKTLAFIQSRPEFEASGISPEGGNVWARFTDGVLYFVSNAFGPSPDTLPGDPLPPDTAAPQFLPHPNNDNSLRPLPNRATSGTQDDLPKSVGYRVMTTLGPAFPAAQTTVARLKSWLTSEHYIDMGTLTTVNGLKTVGGEGFFCFLTHGAVGNTVTFDTTAVEYGLWTSTSAETINDIKPYTNDFILRRLCYFTCPTSIDWANKTVTFATRIGITSKFVSYYWHPFAQNAIVIIDACASDSVPAFRSAVQSKNGTAYFGWSRTVSCKGACYSTEFLVDRLLGVNKAYPREDPKQRAFPISQVWGDLTAKGLNVQPGGDGVNATTSTFRFHDGSSNFGLLAPSIMFASVNDNTDKLTLVGNFGSDPGSDGKVTVNGVERPVNSWNTSEIVCDIASFGPGSAGPVKVMVRGSVGDLVPLTFRESNTVNLTEWQGQMRFTRDELGSLHIGGSYDMHFRADVQDYRVSPGTPPMRLFNPSCGTMKDAEASVSASGSYQYCEGNTCDLFEWLGNANVPLLDISNPGGPSEFYFLGDIDVDGGMIRMNFDNQSRSGMTQRTTVDGPDTHYVITDSLSETDGTEIGLFDDNDNEQYFLSLDGAFNITAGTRIYLSDFPFIAIQPGTKATLKMVWDAMTPNFPPDPDDAR